jgi:hypothetical protein
MNKDMNTIGACIAMGVLAGAASASVISRSGPGVPSQGGFSGRATYAVDDGTAETAVRLTAGGVFAAINHFTAVGGSDTINSVDVSWGSAGSVGQTGPLANLPFTVYVWSNLGTSSDPSGGNASLLFSTSSFVNPSNIDNNTFQSVAVPGIAVSGSFFVGVSMLQPQDAYPYGIDLDDPTQPVTSWIAGGTAFDPNNIGFGGGGSIDLASLGFGNFLIRANTIPSPGAVTLLGAAGLVAMRRRRR